MTITRQVAILTFFQLVFFHSWIHPQVSIYNLVCHLDWSFSLGQRKSTPLMLVPEFVQNIQIFPGHMKVIGLCPNLGVMCYIQTTQLSVGVGKSVKLIQFSNVSAREQWSSLKQPLHVMFKATPPYILQFAIKNEKQLQVPPPNLEMGTKVIIKPPE